MTHRRHRIDTLLGGIMQRRVSSVVSNVDVAAGADQLFDAALAYGWNGCMEKSISFVVAGASTEHGVGEQPGEAVRVPAGDNSASIVRASNRVDYAKHTTMQQTQKNRPYVPTLDAAARQTKTASRDEDMLNTEGKLDIRFSRRDVRVRMDFARAHRFYRPATAAAIQLAEHGHLSQLHGVYSSSRTSVLKQALFSVAERSRKARVRGIRHGDPIGSSGRARRRSDTARLVNCYHLFLEITRSSPNVMAERSFVVVR